MYATVSPFDCDVLEELDWELSDDVAGPHGGPGLPSRGRPFYESSEHRTELWPITSREK